MSVNPRYFGAIAGFALAVLWAAEGTGAFFLALALGLAGYVLVAIGQRPRVLIELLQRLERS